MTPRILLIISLLATLPLAAETRPWRNADGTKSIDGLYLKHDASGVTIRRDDQREVTIPLDKLHPDCQAWLKTLSTPAKQEPPIENSVFDKLVFGDTRDEVFTKLKTSEFVEATLPDAMLARTGLNGFFKTRKQIGGLDASLDFDWTEEGTLKEITIHSTRTKADELESKLLPCWKECIELLTKLHGQPISANKQLELSQIQDGSMSATHLWKLEESGTAMLGAAHMDGSFQIVIRYTTEDVKPVIIPAKSANR